ncbi:DNA translocase FtsK [Sulfurimonas sp.]
MFYDQAKIIVKKNNNYSASYLQRKMQIGYTRAVRIIQQLEDNK